MIRDLFHAVSEPRPSGSGGQPPLYTPALLALADRTQLTLQLRRLPNLPLWLAQELETRHASNARRRRHLRDSYTEIATLLTAHHIDFVLLKGFTHELGFGIDPAARIQYDLDFLLAPDSLVRAQSAIETLGYRPHGDHSLSDEHSRPLIRPSTWQWRGDYFDPDIPIQVELHDSLWSPAKDRIGPLNLDAFWSRRRMIEVNGLSIPALAEPYRVAFAAFHALRHILRHDARPAHVHELARFLETRSDDEMFWIEWSTLFTPEMQALQTIAFRFAHEWFACPWPEPLAAEWARQPQRVHTWFREFAWSPAENILHPNKDTVWLHMALTKTFADRVCVFCDRLTPMRLPHRPLLQRLRYHAAAFAPALASGLRWWWAR